MQRKRKSNSCFIPSESSFTDHPRSKATATMTCTTTNRVSIGAVISIFCFVIALLVVLIIITSDSSTVSNTNPSSSWLLSTANSKVRALQTVVSRTSQHDNNNNDSFLVQQNQEWHQRSVQSQSQEPQQQFYHIPMLTSHQVWTRRRKERRILRERRKTKRTRQLQQRQQNNLYYPVNEQQQQLLRHTDSKEERDRHFDPHDVRNHIIDNNHDDDDDEDHSLDLAALYQGFGTHYVDLWIGTPVPQRQTLIVDTGSSLTAFPCVECDPIKCGLKYHTATAFFDPALSETFDKLTCDKRGCNAGKCQHHSDSKHGKDSEGYCSLHQGYSEGSEWRAYEFMDYTYVGGHHFNPVNVTLYEDNDEENDQDNSGHKTKTKKDIAVEPTYVLKFETLATMGCQTSITGLFKTQLADGIMGMDKARKHAFWNQMYQFGSIPTPNFSLCFAKSNLIDTDGSIAGIMTLGGSDSALHLRPMKYAKELRSSSSSYYVRLETMYLFNSNGHALETMLPLDDNNPITKGSTSKQKQEEEGSSTLEELKKSGKLVELEGLEEHQLNTQHGAMVDSGTTSTYFPRVVTGPFKKAWKEMTGFEFGEKSKEMNDMSYGDAMSLPTVVLQLEGVDEVLPGETEHAVDHDEYDDDDTYADDDDDSVNDDTDDDEGRKLQSKSRIKSKTGSVFVSITPSQYVSFTPKDYYNGDEDGDEIIDPYYEYSNDVRGKVRFRITLNHQKATLGASTLIGHDVMFDNTGGMGGGGRIGFAPSNCNYASLGDTHVLPISPQMAQHMMEERDAKTYKLSNETLKLLLVTLVVFVLLLVAMIGNCTYQAYQYGKGDTNGTARAMATALERMQRRQTNANGTTQQKRVRQSESSISNNGETFEGDFDHDDDFHDDETENEEMIQLTSAAVTSVDRSSTDQ